MLYPMFASSNRFETVQHNKKEIVFYIENTTQKTAKLFLRIYKKLGLNIPSEKIDLENASYKVTVAIPYNTVQISIQVGAVDEFLDITDFMNNSIIINLAEKTTHYQSSKSSISHSGVIRFDLTKDCQKLVKR